MSAETVSETAALTTAGSMRWTGASKRERNFYIALGCAALIHASAFIGVFAAKPKELGDPTGEQNAISVSLVTEADLNSRSTVAEPPVAPPSPEQKAQPATPPQPQKPPEETKAEPQPPQEQTPPPQPDAKEADTETPPPPAPDTPKPAEQEQAKLEETKPEDNVPDLFSLQSENPQNMKSEPQAQPKKEESKPAPSKSTSNKPATKPKQKPQQKKVSQLDLTPPDFEAPSLSGRAAAFQRPPGITKSGLNDAFARAVIRALQQTMPQIQGTLGRVTVRIFLSETGDVIEVKLLGAAKDTTLNQSVVFAARQTSYPIPPTGSNTADRTFMVTYIYD